MIRTIARAGAVRYLERLDRTLPDERTRAALWQTIAETHES